MNAMILWLAQGFGIGRVPFAPGTFGSLVGVLWMLVLVRAGNLWLYGAGLLLGLALSVWLCGKAETILKQTDPGSVVLDEIAAMPICFLPWVGRAWFERGQVPAPENFFTSPQWVYTLLIFGLFRLFDILKPWPVRQSQKLPGGWGVTIDDVLAALYVMVLAWFLPK